MLRREALMAMVGMEIVRFQDASNALDDAAAGVLCLARVDLPFISRLLFVGPVTVDQLGAPRATLERLELAGYARRRGALVELTQHARDWVQTLWGPLQQESLRLLGAESTRDLQVMVRVLESIRPVHEAHTTRIRAMLDAPPRSNRLRGGLSPAALRRVQLFIAANLDRPVRLADLAGRAGLSPFHFGRAFKVTMTLTPRAYLEAQRLEKARRLLRESTLPLAQVAAESGLGSQSRFTTLFRRVTGLTPAAYRRGGPANEPAGSVVPR